MRDAPAVSIIRMLQNEGAEVHAGVDQGAGLQSVHGLQVFEGEGSTHGREVDRLPAGHADGPRRTGQGVHHLDPALGARRGVAQHVEGE